MIKLRTLQDRLERTYDIDTYHDVDDFLITDRELVKRLEGSAKARDVEEKLLVREQENGLDLALFLDEDLLRRLVQDDPEDNLHDGNLADFCIMLEGVSHFVHLVWRAQKSRPTSHLELELQAEVDKFVCSIHLLGQQRREVIPSVLHQRLFQQVRFDECLAAHERHRYEEANHYAARYCLHLNIHYLQPLGTNPGGLENELRDFYRLSLQDKIARIERAPAG